MREDRAVSGHFHTLRKASCGGWVACREKSLVPSRLRWGSRCLPKVLLPAWRKACKSGPARQPACTTEGVAGGKPWRSEEHTSELQSLMRISYAVLCLKKKNHTQ